MSLVQNTILVLTFTFTGTLAITGFLQVNPSYDPGICNISRRGKLVLVKDRNDNDKLLVCVKGRKYYWSMLDGHSYGNYFDPARDCSDIVDKVPGAKNGIYWIETDQGPTKAWCDVVTDGGGFMLIGAQNTPVSWDIPSNPSLVHPSDGNHWSSAFGKKDVLDFRVQISTSKRSSDTKAHWFYRFNSPRKLSQLLLMNNGGCSAHYPGVGDVRYVRDLKSGQIVTRRFQCSRFGAHFHEKLGWGKMNKCFGMSCPEGHAYLHKIKLDSSGSFSFSVVSPKSGIRHASTVFLGCDQGQCCACFGPTSDKDYCAPKCKPINGGTVLKKSDTVHAWFWIRSSLPQRVWKKCMEYVKKTKEGKMEKWHLQEEQGVPRKGPCSLPGDVRLNDGVAVVANNRSLNRLPNIQGLLSYRSDDGRLYWKGKTQWKALGSRKEFQDNKNAINNNKNSINNILRELTQLKKEVKILNQVSCKRIQEIDSNAKSGVYKIKRYSDGGHSDIYCQMTSLPGCSGGGWTMVMKINGRKDTFTYSSSYWSNKRSYNPRGGLTAFDDQETKLPTYWSTSFKEICVGMKVGNDLKFVSISYPASSLYSLIADGSYRATNLGRQKWKSLIAGSSLQPHCNREGFNIKKSDREAASVRLGIIGNDILSCVIPDSFIGMGGDISFTYNGCFSSQLAPSTCGNVAGCTADNGDKNTKAMGYILVR